MAKKKKVVKRAISRISTPDNSAPKLVLKAFRFTEDTTDFLDLLGNQSEFVQNAVIKAISEYKEVVCPTCKGKGVIGCEKRKKKRSKAA